MSGDFCPSTRVVLVLVTLVGAMWSLGCEPYRIEHHHRPSFYHSASTDRLPDELVESDGTVIIYGDARRRRDAKRGGDSEGVELMQIREEDEFGNITLRNMFPDHVIANAMMCIRGREWEVMWRQLIAERSRTEFAGEGKGFTEFTHFMEVNRAALMETLNRMSFGYGGPDIVVEQMGGGALRIRLGARVSTQFAFTAVDMVPEGGGLRLYAFR